MNFKEIYKKNKAFILYVFFGVCTTLVNISSYFVCSHILHMSTVVSSTIAWFCGVLFAYFTNKSYVFESNAYDLKKVLIEMFLFFSCRFLTGLVDIALMYILVDILKQNDLIIKVLSNVVVIILNFVASKNIIFKK